jgi:hypothetical protein
MVAANTAISRHEFMRRMNEINREKPQVMRLPLVYSAMDGACVTQAEQIWSNIKRSRALFNTYRSVTL